MDLDNLELCQLRFQALPSQRELLHEREPGREHPVAPGDQHAVALADLPRPAAGVVPAAPAPGQGDGRIDGHDPRPALPDIVQNLLVIVQRARREALAVKETYACLVLWKSGQVDADIEIVDRKNRVLLVAGGSWLLYAREGGTARESLRLLASERGITAIEVKEDKLMLTRNNDYIMLGSKFPRLAAKAAGGRLKEIM